MQYIQSGLNNNTTSMSEETMGSSGNKESRKRKSDIDREEAEYSDDNKEHSDNDNTRHKRRVGKRNSSKQDKKKSKKHGKKQSHKEKKKRKQHRRHDHDSSSSSSSSDDDSQSASDTDPHTTSSDERKHRKRKKSRKEKKDKPKMYVGLATPSSEQQQQQQQQQLIQVNHATATNVEDKEERHQRRIEARTTLIQSKFGYTADNNPFNDPNLMDTFVWTKKRQQKQLQPPSSSKKTNDESSKVQKKKKVNTIELINEIDKVRERRQNREEQKMEMERMKEEENRLKEYALYDNYQQKEELFHLQQQKLRSALRLINHREKPIDIFAKHILLFGGLSSSSTSSSDETNLDNTENNNRSNRNANLFTKYQERYNVLDIAMETLDIEIEEPYVLLRSLKLNELQELLIDIDAYRTLEREAAAVTSTDATDSNDHTILLKYWDNLYTVTLDEIKYVQSGGHINSNDKDGTSSSTSHAKMIKEISNIFVDQSISDLIKMKNEIYLKLQLNQDTKNVMNMDNNTNEQYDVKYWTFIYEQIMVHIAKSELSALHQQMLLRQLERLENKKEELQLAAASAVIENDNDDHLINSNDQSRYSERNDDYIATSPGNASSDMLGDLEEELGLTDEVDISTLSLPKQQNYNNSNMEDDKYRTRKPRYYNHVKSGFDWSKYNQTHYDKDNPPPKIVLGYKFNIFYPELIDPINQTPSYVLEPVINPSDGTVNNEYCIIRFHAGPPYEDIAFQIVNREWNRSRKRGFKCTFERGILSLYFNFTTHWYRR